jgi:hypothetical protein
MGGGHFVIRFVTLANLWALERQAQSRQHLDALFAFAANDCGVSSDSALLDRAFKGEL